MRIEDLSNRVKERDKILIKFLMDHKGEVFTCDELENVVKDYKFAELLDELCRLACDKKIGVIDLDGHLWFGCNDSVERLKCLINQNGEDYKK